MTVWTGPATIRILLLTLFVESSYKQFKRNGEENKVKLFEEEYVTHTHRRAHCSKKVDRAKVVGQKCGRTSRRKQTGDVGSLETSCARYSFDLSFGLSKLRKFVSPSTWPFTSSRLFRDQITRKYIYHHKQTKTGSESPAASMINRDRSLPIRYDLMFTQRPMPCFSILCRWWRVRSGMRRVIIKRFVASAQTPGNSPVV